MDNVNHFLWGESEEKNEMIPKIIWLFWEGNHSEVVNRCIEKLNSTLEDYDIRVLNFISLRHYLPSIIDINTNLPLANYSDIIRLDLLRTYGGIWIDASTLITRDLSWIEEIKNEFQPELIGFYSDLYTKNDEFPILETWFLAAVKNSRFIQDWYSEYKKCYLSKFPHQYYASLKDNNIIMQGLYKDPSVDYLIAYLSAMKLMYENKNYRIFMFSSNDSAHYYKFKLKYSLNEFEDLFLKLNNVSVSDLPFLVKFVNTTRDFLDFKISNSFYSNKSLLFRISPDKNYRFNKFMRNINYVKFISQNIYRKFMKRN